MLLMIEYIVYYIKIYHANNIPYKYSINMSTTIYEIASTLYLDRQDTNKCYKRILTINNMPTDGALKDLVKRVTRSKLSPFQVNTCDSSYKKSNCIYAIKDPDDTSRLLCIDDITRLFTFLSVNGYTIDIDLTKIILKNERVNAKKDLICFIKGP
jgi:hypothetical protein